MRHNTAWETVAIVEELLLLTPDLSTPASEAADAATRALLAPAAQRWPGWTLAPASGAASPNRLLYEALLMDASTVAVPHLDAAAARGLFLEP